MHGPGQAPAEERRNRPRRVDALLKSYYSIEGSAQKDDATQSQSRVCSDLDRQGFDAKRYFDGIVHSGKLPDLVQRSSELDAEVKDLDTEMQKLVNETYTQFTRAASVISRMKVCIEKFEPDMGRLEGSIGRISKHQDKAEAGVAENSRQLHSVVKQQRVCKKLDALFGLPAMLQRCLDQGAFEQAADAYNCCSDFLAQYKQMPTFQNIHREVESSMRSIKEAVEKRLQLPSQQLWEAVRDARTLLRLGADLPKVVSQYLAGRSAVLQRSLEACFEPEAGSEAKDGSDLTLACARAGVTFAHCLCEAVEGFYELQDGSSAAGSGPDESLLSEFVSAQIGSLFEQMSRIVEQSCPPAKVLVSSTHVVRDALRPINERLPRLLPKIFMQLVNTIASKAMETLFSNAASATISDLSRLHEECTRLEGLADAGLDAVLEEVTKTEQGLIMNSVKALMECQPLLGLLDADQAAAQQFVRRLHGHLISFFLTFVDACYGFTGQDMVEARVAFPTLPAMPRLAVQELAHLAQLEWRGGLFGLILVRMGRHLEVKVISKVWAVAKDMFGGSPELTPHPAVIRVTRVAAQAVITHYTMVAGQRLAHLIRDLIQSQDWITGNEPREPLFLSTVVKEMSLWDAQLARILSDPRKEHPGRRSSRMRNPMELEMERLLAKKLQTYAPAPFNRNGVVVGILRIAFKAIYEYLREVTFGKLGLQQIQVDTAFLTLFVQGFAEADDANVLESILAEALTSALARCGEPELMDAAIVEALCQDKKREYPGLLNTCDPN